MSDDGTHELKVFLVIDYSDSVDYCIASDDGILWYVSCNKDDGLTFYSRDTECATVKKFQEYMDELSEYTLYNHDYCGYTYAKERDGKTEVLERADMMKDLE